MGTDSQTGFIYIWEYIVKSECVAKFLEHYQPDGTWARFFGKTEDYIRTELYRDSQHPNRFITIDYWRDKKSRDTFNENNREEFSRIDEDCELLTTEENCLGEFEPHSV
ncbi:MAG: hypothetical protein MJA83_03275 [Gammaproteobacteria bacterium]|nr:hypothetical protein [Gammaproteobacteria bacterium]